MKNLLFLIASVCLFQTQNVYSAETLRESSQAKWKQFDFAAELMFNSRYVSDGIATSEEPVLQASAGLSWMNFNAGVWANMDMNETDRQGEFSELDFTLAYDYEFANFKFQPKFVHYTYPNQAGAKYTDELVLGLAYSLALGFDFHSSHRIDVKENDGAYIGSFGPGYSFDLSDRLGFTTALDLSWSSAKFAKNLLSVDKTGLLSLVGTANATWYMIPNVYMKPSIQWSSMINSDYRDQAKVDSLDRDLFTASLALGAEF